MVAATSLLYFAYGSNMSLLRLRIRTPSAEILGRAWLADHRLAFHKVGRDGSGKCDIAPQIGERVHGVVFKLSNDERSMLDRHEDLGRGYEARWIDVEHEGGRRLQVLTYRALLRDPSLRPYPWYREHVLRGATENALPGEYIAKIAATNTVEDPEPERERRERSIYLEIEA